MSIKTNLFCLKVTGHTCDLYKMLIRKLGYLLLGRYSLIVTSMIILVISANVLRQLYSWELTPADDLEEMIQAAEGISSLFLGIGLILKERKLLEKIFGTDLHHEEWTDKICLNTGLCLILNGTAMRLAAQLIRIPDRYISTGGKELLVFNVGLLFCTIASLLLVYFILKLSFGNRCEVRNKTISDERTV